MVEISKIGKATVLKPLLHIHIKLNIR